MGKKGRGLWDTIPVTRPTLLERSRISLNAVAFFVDGIFLAFALKDITINILDTASGALFHSLGGHDNYVTDINFSLDGNMVASASKNWIVRLWNIATRKMLNSLSIAVKKTNLYFARGSKDLKIDQVLLRVESLSLEVVGIGLTPPPSYFFSSSNMLSNASGLVVLIDWLNSGAMDIPSVM